MSAAGPLFAIGIIVAPIFLILRRFSPGISLPVSIILSFYAGICLYQLRVLHDSPPPTAACRRLVEGTLISAPESFAERTRLKMRLSGISSCQKEKTTSDILPHHRLAYITVHSPKLTAIAAGDRLRFAAHLQPRKQHNISFNDFSNSFHYTASLTESSNLIVLSKPNALSRRLQTIRWRIQRLIMRTLDEPDAAVAIALTTGQRHLLTPEIRHQFQQLGTGHLLAVSGLHLGIFALLSYRLSLFIFRRIPPVARRTNVQRISAALAIPAVLFFTIFTGANPPVVRACVMSIFVMLAIILEKNPYPSQSILLAASLLLASDPVLITNVGFQLSFASVAAIMICNKTILPFMTNLQASAPRHGAPEGRVSQILILFSRWLSNLLKVSIIASAATAPILAMHFHSVPILAPIANMFFVPLVSLIIMPLLLLSLPLGIFQSSLAETLIHLAQTPLKLFISTTSFIADYAPEISCESYMSRISIFAASMGLLLFVKGKLRPAFFAVITFLATALCHLLLVSDQFPSGALTLDFLDVGQGDATLVTFPQGKHWLIDAGGTARYPIGSNYLLPLLRNLNVRQLDKVILSHPDPDHVAGIPDILKSLKVKEIWENGQGRQEAASPAYKQMIQIAKQKKIRMEMPSRFCGRTMEQGVTAVVIHPCVKHSSYFPTLSFNDNSIVVRLSYTGHSVLLPGDLSRDGEEIVLASPHQLHSDILKLGHHGSSSSSTKPFLERVRPHIAIASSGYFNQFGFPSKPVVERLLRNDTKIYSTNQEGWIRIIINKAKIKVITQKRQLPRHF
ncbi:MAG: DNA internalization-related competence protein ComEC/Rec2 [Deltaproteobacteria bacterium]|nr:DNA internalization-related competence protein ComEC/Rec2 [Deltaproteobacteria bacterium]